MEQQKTSLTYRILRKYKILANSKYKNISLLGFIFLVPKKIFVLMVYHYAYASTILEPINYKSFRAKCWKWMGCNIGKNIGIGRHVEIDYGNADLITIEDNVLIAHGCSFLCHKRDNHKHFIGNNPYTLPYVIKGITLKKYCQVGTNAMILPGVTIGEGAIVGACSVVTKDVPDWSIVVGFPAKVIRMIQTKEEYENTSSNK